MNEIQRDTWKYILYIFTLMFMSLLTLTISQKNTQPDSYNTENTHQIIIVRVYIPSTQEKDEPPKIEDTEIEEKVVSDIKKEQPTKEFTITAYDNSVASQEQWVDQTATGFNLKGHTLESARCIAVDPKIIPLGKEVKLTFDEQYKHLNGVYIARDTGGAIKGNVIDLFMGDGVDKKEVNSFGRRKVQVQILD